MPEGFDRQKEQNSFNTSAFGTHVCGRWEACAVSAGEGGAGRDKGSSCHARLSGFISQLDHAWLVTRQDTSIIQGSTSILGNGVVVASFLIVAIYGSKNKSLDNDHTVMLKVCQSRRLHEKWKAPSIICVLLTVPLKIIEF